VFTFSMNKAKYNSMSPAQKKVMDDHCTTEWAVKVASPFVDFEVAGRAKMKAAPGHEVYQLTSEQLQDWKSATAPLQNAWADAITKIGGDPIALWQEFKAELQKGDAGF
jgi:TRAP-type C4-dicarboxylate transport system substrate-binding protein